MAGIWNPLNWNQGTAGATTLNGMPTAPLPPRGGGAMGGGMFGQTTGAAALAGRMSRPGWTTMTMDPAPAPSGYGGGGGGGGSNMLALGYDRVPRSNVITSVGNGGESGSAQRNYERAAMRGPISGQQISQAQAYAKAHGGTFDPAKGYSWANGLPGFATGGVVPPGQPAIVGENGPEVIVPQGQVQVIPNEVIGKYAQPGMTPAQSTMAAGARENPGPPKPMGPPAPTMQPLPVMTPPPMQSVPAPYFDPMRGVPQSTARRFRTSPQAAMLGMEQAGAMARQGQQMAWQQNMLNSEKTDRAAEQAAQVQGLALALKMAHPGEITPAMESALSKMKPAAALAFLPTFAGHLTQQQQEQRANAAAAMPSMLPEGAMPVPIKWNRAGQVSEWSASMPQQPDQLMPIPGTNEMGVIRNGQIAKTIAQSPKPKDLTLKLTKLPTGEYVYQHPETGVPIDSLGVYDQVTTDENGKPLAQPAYKRRAAPERPRIINDPQGLNPAELVTDPKTGAAVGYRALPKVEKDGTPAASTSTTSTTSTSSSAGTAKTFAEFAKLLKGGK